jgi:Domain of unknown function (DUF4365)
VKSPVADGSLMVSIDVKHYNSWIQESSPLFLMLYDAKADVAYWQYFQAFFGDHPRNRPRPGQRSVTITFPKQNVLNADAVDYIRERKRAAHEQAREWIRHAF